jgi:hypothetical protein
MENSTAGSPRRSRPVRHRDAAGAVSTMTPRGGDIRTNDNAWLVFWDAERRISAAIDCSTSFNGGQRFARAALAHDGRVVSCDEIPDVGRLSRPSINLDGALLPSAEATGTHRVAISTPGVRIRSHLDATLATNGLDDLASRPFPWRSARTRSLAFDGSEWGRGYGCIPHAILRRLS